MHVRRWLLALGLATSAAAGACSLSGLSDGIPKGDDDGGGQLPTDSGPSISDGPSDAGAPDAPPTFCTPDAHTFCDDFDHAALGTLWDFPPGSGITLTSKASASPPNSLDILCGGAGACWMRKRFPNPTDLKFQLRVTVGAVDGNHTIWEIAAEDGSRYILTTYRIDTSGNGDAFQICEKTGCSQTVHLPDLKIGTFRKISGEVHFGDGGTVSLSIDDQQVFTDLGPVGIDGTKGVVFGVGDDLKADGTSEFLIDDVAIDTF